MPYYGAGDYYQGDNYGAGGLFSFAGKALKGVTKVVSRLGIPGISGAAGLVSAAIPGFGRPAAPQILAGFGPPAGFVPRPGFKGKLQRFLPGGESGYIPRRRINPLNIKALRRAMRRAKGFEKQARRVGSFFSPGKTYRLKGRARKRA